MSYVCIIHIYHSPFHNSLLFPLFSNASLLSVFVFCLIVFSQGFLEDPGQGTIYKNMGSLPMIIPPLNVSSSPRNYLLSRHTQVEMSLLDCSPPHTHQVASIICLQVLLCGTLALCICCLKQGVDVPSLAQISTTVEVKSSAALLCSRDGLHLISLFRSFIWLLQLPLFSLLCSLSLRGDVDVTYG